MKIYYIASISLKDKYGEAFKQIGAALKKLEFEVNDTNLVGWDLKDLARDKEYRKDHYRKVIKDIKNADIIVSEVSFPSSINVGHEITVAMDMEKPVLALYSKGNSPIFLEGNTSDKFILAEYDPTDMLGLEKLIKSSLKKLLKTTDIRFNFFISPEIVRYLDWVAKIKRVPRSVYLRDLIEDDMKKHKEYGTQG